jgi:hypothetical protein
MGEVPILGAASSLFSRSCSAGRFAIQIVEIHEHVFGVNDSPRLTFCLEDRLQRFRETAFLMTIRLSVAPQTESVAGELERNEPKLDAAAAPAFKPSPVFHRARYGALVLLIGQVASNLKFVPPEFIEVAPHGFGP